MRRWTIVSAVSIMLFTVGVVGLFLSAALSGRSAFTVAAGTLAAAGFAGMVAGKAGSLWTSRGERG